MTDINTDRKKERQKRSKIIMEDRDKVFSPTFGSPTREEIFEQWFALFVTQCSLERIVLRCSMGCFINRHFIKRPFINRQFINRHFIK